MSYPPYQTPIAGSEKVTREWLLYFRNLVAGGGGGAAPASGTFVVAAPTGTLPNSRVATSTATIGVNTGTAGLIKWDLANTAVTPGTYGDATHVGQFTVDQQGRLTAAANIAVTSSLVLKTSATLTDTNIKNLGVPTPFTIASGLGANLVLMPLFFILKAYTSAGAYTGLTNGAFLQIRYVNGPELISGYIPNDSTTTPAINRLTDLLGTTTNRIQKLNTPFSEETDPLTNEWGNLDFNNTLGVANSALQIEGSGFAGVLGGGNAANHLDIDTYYVSVSV